MKKIIIIEFPTFSNHFRDLSREGALEKSFLEIIGVISCPFKIQLNRS